ncbi:hypothetical protein AB0H94_35495 [Streptomyces purpurascens]
MYRATRAAAEHSLRSLTVHGLPGAYCCIWSDRGGAAAVAL